MKPDTPRFPPALVMFLGVLAVSTGSLFIRFAQTEVNSLVISAYRLGLSVLVLLPIAFRRHGGELQRLKKIDWLFALLSGAFLALHFASWITSLEYTSVTSSVVFVNTSPLWVALASPLLLNERLTRLAWTGVIVSFLGGIIVGVSDVCVLSAAGLSCSVFVDGSGSGAMWGNFLALVGAWALAAYLMLGRRLRPNISLTGYIFIVYGIAACVMIAVVAAAGLPVSGFSARTYLWLALLALIPQLLGHTASNYALAYLPASFVAVALLGEPVGSTILAASFLNEFPSLLKITGGIVTLTGIYLVSQARE